MNKFEQVSSDGHQMSPAGARARVRGMSFVGRGWDHEG